MNIRQWKNSALKFAVKLCTVKSTSVTTKIVEFG
jgi:hypothetical protein